MNEIKCPYCSESNAIKKGTRQKKFGIVQIFQCMHCNKKFIPAKNPSNALKQKIALQAITHFNLGNSLMQTTKYITKQFKASISKSTIFNWLNEFNQTLGFEKAKRIPRKENEAILIEKSFLHNGLNYEFKLHQPKTKYYCKSLPTLEKYLQKFAFGCPNKFFENSNRISQQKLEVKVEIEKKYNHACKMAEMVLEGIEDNKQRHQAIEKFMLANDSCTIAAEIPVWFWEKSNGGKGYSGHIDLLQTKFNKIFILDYKPNAEKEKNATSQLYLYAQALSFRTGISLENIKCAWFNEKAYYEFNPKEAKINWQAIEKQENEPQKLSE